MKCNRVRARVRARVQARVQAGVQARVQAPAPKRPLRSANERPKNSILCAFVRICPLLGVPYRESVRSNTAPFRKFHRARCDRERFDAVCLNALDRFKRGNLRLSTDHWTGNFRSWIGHCIGTVADRSKTVCAPGRPGAYVGANRCRTGTEIFYTHKSIVVGRGWLVPCVALEQGFGHTHTHAHTHAHRTHTHTLHTPPVPSSPCV